MPWQYGPNGEKKWLEYGIRKKLIRRIIKGDICGRIKADGEPCLAPPKVVGGHCEDCQKRTAYYKTNLHPATLGSASARTYEQASPAVMMWHLLGRQMDPQVRDLLHDLAAMPTDNMDDLIHWARLRMVLLVRRYTEGRLTTAEYETAAQKLSSEMRKLVEANMRVQLMKVEADKLKVEKNFGDDAFDPAAPSTEDEEPGPDEDVPAPWVS